MNHVRCIRLAPSALLLALLLSGPAQATNGYFSHGYGIKAVGMAGAGMALPQDGMASATNPAGIAFVGNRADIGLLWFQPKRDARVRGNAFGLDGSFSGNGKQNFHLPEIGYVRQLGPEWAASLAIYGHGGMNTDYRRNPWAGLGASGSAGVSLEQLFISPALAYKPGDRHAFGLALNFAHQRFKAKGIQPFAASSATGDRFSNRGSDSANGWGVRLGYTGEISPGLTLGLSYASKTRMSKFDRYRGLFADQGRFDIPASYGLGLAWQASPSVTLAAGVQHIEYSKVNSVGNLLVAKPFGSSNGPGFGWRDMTVLKLGVSHAFNDSLTLRAGYSHASQPIRSSEVMLNILAPGVIQEHLSVGASWKVGAQGELSLAYTHALRASVSGELPAQFGGGKTRLSMHQNSLGVAYSWKY